MQKVIFFAPLYERIVDEYNATLYIKGRVNVRKKNHLIRFVPSMFRIKKHVREYLMESYSQLHFTSPDIYDQKVEASVGTVSKFWEIDGHLPEYFHVNIYSSSLLYDKLLSPLSVNARKYYTYYVDSIMGDEHARRFRIRFIPKNKSYQLVAGYMVVSDHVWSVREIRFAGRSEMLRFHNRVQMGDVGADDEFLPVQYEVDASFRFLGNKIDGTYTAVLGYRDIRLRDASKRWQKERGRGRYNLSDSYSLRCDTNAYKRDTAYFNRLRPIPLTAGEEKLYADFHTIDSLSLLGKKSRRLEFWGEMGDVLVNRYTVDLSRMGSVRCSPLINPFLMSYSQNSGFAYRQEFKYNCLFSGDRLLRIVPKLGYNFKRKEFYWSMNADFDYWPQKRAAVHLNLGNGNRIYSSDVLDDLKSMPDSLFDFDQVELHYFHNLYFKLSHSWEMVNGLQLDMGISIHHRTRIQRGEIADRLRRTYNSFAPRVRLTWTPGQYYYMNGKRKVNLRSDYPTFSAEWERGISGIINSTNQYERIELDGQYRRPLGLLRSLYLRMGWGMFTNQKELYFVDFSNFTRSNLPVGWNDEIGGVFQLLDSRWYNSSRSYVRAHATYEAPFLLLRHLSKYTQYVLNERLYLNLLFVPHLNPYIETGYGIGTHVFDFGVFAGFTNGKFREVGCKFTFELFNR